MSCMADFFPRELMHELSIVLDVIPQKTFNDVAVGVSEEQIEYKVKNDAVSIPYRIYFLEPSDNEISKLTTIQRRILYCMYTRCCNGYLREKYIRKLLACNFEEWCIPYIVKLCDEYVVEILYVLYDSLSGRSNDAIKAFCAANKRATRKGHARMISYWNEYYRAENHDLSTYIGTKLFRECLGYRAASHA